MRLGKTVWMSCVILALAVPASWSQTTEGTTGDTPAEIDQNAADSPAQDSPAIETAVAGDGILLELNGAVETENNSCRLTVVTTNRLDKDLSRAAWQVAIFNADGVVQSLPILDFGAMVAGKTKVAMFELPESKCTDIGRIIVNDVAACTTADDKDLRDACLGGLETQSRTDIDFGL